MAAKKSKKTSGKNGGDFYQRFFALVERRGWYKLTLPEIAKATGISLSQLLETYPDKSDILTQFGRALDAKLAQNVTDSDEPLKDKLFDVVMQRFDALAPYRAGLLRLSRICKPTPSARWCCALKRCAVSTVPWH